MHYLNVPLLAVLAACSTPAEPSGDLRCAGEHDYDGDYSWRPVPVPGTPTTP
jgi:hypothetical protein